jgi:hypothetical protein
MTIKLIGMDDATPDAHGGATLQNLCRFQAVASGNMTEFKVKFSGAGTVAYAVYADSAGSPTTRLAQQATPQAVVAGWNTLAISSVSIISGNYYWLAVYIATGNMGYNNSGGTRKYKAGATTFPDPFNNTGFTDDSIPLFEAGWGTGPQTISPSSITQAIAYGTPTVYHSPLITIIPSSIVQAVAIGTPVVKQAWLAVTDLQDWMDSVNIVATMLNLPISIKAAEATIPIDIKAVTVGTLSVDIVAAAIGNLLISVAAQSVGVYLQPEWAAKQNQDKNFLFTDVAKTWLQSTSLQYTVTTGKTLYIIGAAAGMYSSAAADYDHHLRVGLRIRDVTTSILNFDVSGESGVLADFSKPLSFASGHTVEFMAENRSNITCDLVGTAWGYEI